MKQFLPNPEKFSQGHYIPVNPHKYRGKLPIRYLSAWELKVCKMFDLNPNVLFWSSESVAIQYIHPVKSALNKRPIIATYYPDYTVVYVDVNGKQHKEIVEVKPARQAIMEKAKSRKEKIDVVVNQAKWEAARNYAKNIGYSFRVLTEYQIFGGKR